MHPPLSNNQCESAEDFLKMATKVDPDLTDAEKKLYEYINEGKSEEAKALLQDPKIRIDCADEHGMTPLQHAAYKGEKELCELLLAQGANVNSNHHDHGYTTLMFASLSGSKETTKLMLEAGANTTSVNNVGRTASQMAAFVGQHQCVSLINNFFSKADLEYYTVPRGVETEPKLPAHLCTSLYKLILMNNLHPVKLSLYLQENPGLMAEVVKIRRLLDLLCEKMMKQKNTNEVLAIKFHYLSSLVEQSGKCMEDSGDNLETWIKRMLRARSPDCFPEDQELFIRSIFKTFPYVDSSLLQQMVRSLANTKVGDDPAALVVLTQGINGQRMASDDDMPCTACNEFGAIKKCSACKMTNYCNQQCQKLHWFTHKRFCKHLKAEYKRIEKLKLEQEQFEKEEAERREREEKENKPDTTGDNNEVTKDKEETKDEDKNDEAEGDVKKGIKESKELEANQIPAEKGDDQTDLKEGRVSE